MPQVDHVLIPHKVNASKFLRIVAGFFGATSGLLDREHTTGEPIGEDADATMPKTIFGRNRGNV